MASKKIGALWVRKSKNGDEFFSGVLDLLGEDIQIAVFYNDRKEKDNQPDFQIVRSGQREDQDESNSGRRSYSRHSEETGGLAHTTSEDEIDINEIPFD